MDLNKVKIAVIGLGYVGLPLAIEFSKKYPTIGFDINTKRVEELKKGYDSTGEVQESSDLVRENISFTCELTAIKQANVYIVTVPTPISKTNEPDLSPLLDASTKLGKILKKGDTVIYESTVYPGATEEDCVPLLEGYSGLRLHRDFAVGYSPERVNPGDKTNRISNIVKVTSGSCMESSQFIDGLYKSIIKAGTYLAPTIRIAEASKVIENTQRDVNIALVNELAMIFSRMGIDTHEVLKAASTKWNFLNFKPGLVGGHCIGVDPYYLFHKASVVGFPPELIRVSRKINNEMPKHISSQFIKALFKSGLLTEKSEILILGATFKENCPDLRNSKVFDVFQELIDYGLNVKIYDPVASKQELNDIYGSNVVFENGLEKRYEGVIIAVAHTQFISMGFKSIKRLMVENGIIYDLKAIFGSTETSLRL
ncbi:nucleotide sugar dehydrogenase [Pseudidiomarina terrestris]|uniref:nucleotide sugar dehydrogenase n=1 Tax=Pseudidiomarina terrestris TaxID=2820060 RepID=UPI00264C54F6|nr:nucleotide sugar dehydrogenase [Pseudidiomarina sp. 1ASP75-5]MDN7134533.1 nucleotide sugar dehydrogenase [Pseudidiomarina sp. 1ASP75-5]